MILASLLGSGCFPTLQSPFIDPGWRVDAGATMLTDQRRNEEAQGPDYLLYLTPAFGFGRRLEVGIPVGIYLEEGMQSLRVDARDRYGTNPRTIAVWPYVKAELTAPDASDRIALAVQSAVILPANIGITWGRDLGAVRPMAGVTFILSGGPAGDDPVVTRYQEAGQNLIAFHAGAELEVAGRPGLAVGVLRNHYREGAVFGDFGQETTPRTLWDLFVGLRFRIR